MRAAMSPAVSRTWAACVPCFLLHPLDAPERAQGLTPCVLARHAVGDVLLGLEIDVRPELAIELVVDAFAPGERADAKPDHVEPAERHGGRYQDDLQ